MQQIATRQAAKLERTFAFVLNKLHTQNNLLFSEHTYTRTFETYCYEEKNCNGVKNIGSILKEGLTTQSNEKPWLTRIRQ